MVCSVGTGTAAEYYLNEQVEYYTGGKEPKGRWYALPTAFDLKDGAAINAEAFRNLHAGLSPDGIPLGQKDKSFKSARVGGYDLTFSAPKSVSILWAVADEGIRTAIEVAQERAARAALDVLSRNASYARRGKGGGTLEKVKMIGATFQHGEARPVVRDDGSVASDPQLHTHSVVFNMAERNDGTWGALDGRHFYKWKMAAGAIYRAHLAHEMRTNLGVEIEVKKYGMFELVGISDDVRDHFSLRRNEINKNLAAIGLNTKDAQALASAVAKSSRRTKVSGDETAQGRHVRWKREAEELGLTEKTVAACVNKHVQDLPTITFADKLREIPNQLTEHEAVFPLETLYRAVAETALASGVSSNQVDRIVNQMMRDEDVIEIGSDELCLPVFSTSEMVSIEHELVDVAARRGKLRKHRLETRAVETHLRSSKLTQEQQVAVRFVTCGADVAVLEGSAGAGKTYALKTVADAYRAEGYRVIGTSTAWRMARQLRDDLGVEAKATDAWLAQDKAGKTFLDRKTVLFVDEAGQLSSRQMLKVLKAAEDAQAKVILTGDQRQLQAIGAGPGLRLVAEQAGVARIDTIIRQRDAWARHAVEDLSLGRADKAVAAFEEHDTLVWCSDGADAVQKAVGDWKSFKESSPNKTAMVLAKTNAQVRALNMEMRSYLRETGCLRGDEHTISVVDTSGRSNDLEIAPGDQVLFKKRIDELGVINGSLATVTHIEADQKGLNISIDVDGCSVNFAMSAIADHKGRVPIAHGYASTIFSAQGATVDAAYVVADHTMRRNEAYVAASRAREITCLYLDREKIDNAARSQMPLSEPARSMITHEQRRQVLVETWKRTQTKSSTRDFIISSALAEQRLMNKVSMKNMPTQKVQLPQIELGK